MFDIITKSTEPFGALSVTLVLPIKQDDRVLQIASSVEKLIASETDP
ncbi:hypothetical protein DesyoDRAFT_2050 [Desulfosporosinus youngiae DSM 17734]|uniref:Uncharacterized protein n=1 Tax=Desulfosporosinus youngiae DSM 17734 TaxID=768710 RepID=H5XU52_9FIRM|nr:hypothetical protein DesyoDRAFT_2050 [Desulfosporosinus youngiae DSM 17734]